MQFRGIDFDIKAGIGKGQWIWVIHIPTPRQGRVTGPRERALIAAKRAIDEWCDRHPEQCEPKTSAA
jgi:hypothetical protein